MPSTVQYGGFCISASSYLSSCWQIMYFAPRHCFLFFVTLKTAIIKNQYLYLYILISFLKSFHISGNLVSILQGHSPPPGQLFPLHLVRSAPRRTPCGDEKIDKLQTQEEGSRRRRTQLSQLSTFLRNIHFLPLHSL